MSEALGDEVISINAIYPDSLSQLSGDEYMLNATETSLSLVLSFPHNYPKQAPLIKGSSTVDKDVRKDEAARQIQRAREVLKRIFQPDQPCIYDFIEALAEDRELGRKAPGSPPALPKDTNATKINHEEASAILDKAPAWVLSEIVTEKKSVFVARAVRAQTVQDARGYIQHLVTTDKKAAKATHNITAWRIRDDAFKPGQTFQDCDDDGETAAGSRLLHLLQIMDLWNIVVVVTRWYGGIQLGPDRFRIINRVARDAITKGEFGES